MALTRHKQSTDAYGYVLAYSALNPLAGPFGAGSHLGIWSLYVQDGQLYDANVYNAILRMPTGETTLFNCAATGAFPVTCTNAGRADYLKGVFTYTGTTTATFKTEDGTRYDFARVSSTDNAGMRLIRITNRFNKATTLAYTGDNLTKVTAPNGQGINLSYTDSRFPYQITKVQLFDNNNAQLSTDNYSVSYVYDANGDLAQFYNLNHGKTVQGVDSTGAIVNRTASGLWSYTYESHLVKTIKNPRGIVSVSNSYTTSTDPYEPYSRINKQIKPGGDVGTTADDVVNYYSFTTQTNLKNGLLISSKAYVRDTTNSTSRQISYNVTDYGYASGVTNYADSSTYSSSIDIDTGLARDTTNPLGYKTSYTYTYDGTYDHLYQQIEHNTLIVSTFSFTAPFGQLASQTDPLQHTTTFDYSAANNSCCPGVLTGLNTPYRPNRTTPTTTTMTR